MALVDIVDGASRDIAYNIHPIHGGDTKYHEEGLVDIGGGPCSFRTIPALVASDPSRLPIKCMLLLGVPQFNKLNIKVDTHRKTRRLPLESYDPSIDFSADTFLQCRMAEKDLLAWAEHNKEVPVGYSKCSHLVVIYSDALTADELRQLRAASATYKRVYNAAKGALPALANHPNVTLNFKEGWMHVSVPVPRWGPGATAVLTRWAREMLDNGLYTTSKSPFASRPHIVRKTPPDVRSVTVSKNQSIFCSSVGGFMGSLCAIWVHNFSKRSMWVQMLVPCAWRRFSMV
jgi:hypothetical protein